ncbi:MAG TPA: hypothetical protein DCQ64_09750 [Candidatus Rokubacteria bacterium]|nr:hypothetical protein [Candidatus Rokubacteria bacterium]
MTGRRPRSRPAGRPRREPARALPERQRLTARGRARRRVAARAGRGYTPQREPRGIARERGGHRSQGPGPGRGGRRRDHAAGLGVPHGGFCLGCCWVLMALLFVAGVMNLLWVAAIAAFVLVEKLVPLDRLVSYTAGVLLAAWGLWVIVRSL